MEVIGIGFAAKIALCGDTGATQAISVSAPLVALPKGIAADRRVPPVTRGGG